jgi:hypothetical protein
VRIRGLSKFSGMIRTHHLAPIVFGPFIAANSIICVHVAGLYLTPEKYMEAPPTVSRLLVDPAFSEPFAVAMIASAAFLVVAISQVGLFLHKCITISGQGTVLNRALLHTAMASEMIAVVGMIVLSQFTGSANSKLHDAGSYMLFLGHAIGISLIGILVRNLLAAGLHEVAAPIAALRKFPVRAGRIAALSILYGAVYFGGKFLPDDVFFWQRTVLSTLEIVLILSFLGFLMSFMPMIGAVRTTAVASAESPGSTTDVDAI